MSASFDEPSIPPRLRRPLAALWISLGLHAAVIALVQVVPPAGVSVEAPVIEVRLVAPSAPAANVPPPSPVVPVPEVAPAAQLAPSPAPKALPVAPPPPAVVPPPTTTPAHDAPLPMAPTVPAAAKTAPALSPEAAPVPAAALTSSVDLTYYNARDLDVQPHALRVIRPDYPVEADRQRMSGTLRLQLKLEADGRISDIEVVSATPPGVFEDSAIKAFRDARFAPAQKNGRPVRALVVIEVVYDWAGQPR
ncbi:MAG: energy transducer TonB [Betaproteobacteria bacterium]|nr:energy transducer TonB [Betaproteobacteria bacterium]